MKLWINWICVMLLGLTPLILHLFMKKPRAQSLSYDLAGLISDPPNSEPDKPEKSFAKIRSIDEVDLPVEAIRNCLKKSRDLSRSHAVKNTKPVNLEKYDSEAAEISVDTLIGSLSSPANLAKDINRKEAETTKTQEVQPKKEADNVIRPSRTKIVQQSTASHNGNRSHSHVRNLDAVLEIQASRRSSHL